MANSQRTVPRWLAPEVVQTSAMDCGPAALKSLLEGFGIPVSYGRLREACQTDVDGASINTLEDIVNQLGLEVEQVVAPLDHLLLPEDPIAPAVVVVRQPNGFTHFVVLWRLHGNRLVQVMDPARGRRWMSRQSFLDELYLHRMPFAADMWREWAGSAGFCDPLSWRLAQLGLDSALSDRLLASALADPTWQSIAALDAATRMVAAIMAAQGLASGAEAGRVLERFFERARQHPCGADSSVPAAYWLVQPLPPAADAPETGGQLAFQGAVLLQVLGRSDEDDDEDEADPPQAEASEAAAEGQDERAAELAPPPPLSPELAAALAEKPGRPEFELIRFLQQDGWFSPLVLTLAICLGAVGVLIEAMLLGGLIDIGSSMIGSNPIMGMLAALFILAGLLFMLEIPLTGLVLRLGRRFELRWRLAFLTKLPRLDDQYFHSRLTSDMAKRAHELYKLRRLSLLGFNFLRLSFQLLWTVVGIAWLDWRSAPLALLAAALALALPLAAQPFLAELDQRLQSHAGGLSLFYLDSLLGLRPVQAHSAARAMRREHELLLVAWARANLTFYRLVSSVETVTGLVNTGLAVTIVLAYVARGGEIGVILLLAYWSLHIVFLGKSLGELAQQYPRQRNRILRLLEPLNAPEQRDGQPQAVPTLPHEEATAPTPSPVKPSGAAIIMKDVCVLAGGHLILDQIDLSINPGEHIAIIGPSGAGKSSLVGLLLGWYRPAGGQLQVDGQPLVGSHLRQLRQDTVWVDPAVQLWNRTFLHNLRYGNTNGDIRGDLNGALKQADLIDVLKRLPAGMQTWLGEGGGLVSGGEGQRVRLGRGMMRPDARLVILDEPFRGLDRDQRGELLARARCYWPNATLLCITHDIAQTKLFDRVLVVAGGRLVEDNPPAILAARPHSHYRALLSTEESVRTQLWASAEWRRLLMERGRLWEENGRG